MHALSASLNINVCMIQGLIQIISNNGFPIPCDMASLSIGSRCREQRPHSAGFGFRRQHFTSESDV